MKKYCFVFLSLLISMVAIGQTLTVSTNQLNFGTATETNPDSLSLIIYNNMGKTVNVTDIRFYAFYGAPVFSASQSTFSIANGSSQLIWVKFSPLHNIYHNSEMVILNDGQRGAVSVDLLGQGHYSMSYYNTTENLDEEPLKTEIQSITGANYNALGYNKARDTMFMIIDNMFINGQGATQNTLECVYTGRQIIGYTSRAQCQMLTPGYDFNTEHTYPQSLFDLDGDGNGDEPMRSDLHHLFPTDNTANGKRANFPFGVVTSATWQNGGSKFDNNNGIFEPRDVHKGETARAMLYFVLRYQNYSNFLNSQESVLKTWNKNFLPTTVEKTRNNHIALYQQNRNPFVDYPQFADRINSFSNTSTAPVDYSFEKFGNTIDYGAVLTGKNYIYSFIIVNDGNQALQLSNFTLSNTSLMSFNSGGINITIAPGEAYKSEINLTPAAPGSINETLTFNTSNPSAPIVQVPISASASTVYIAEANNASLLVSPNPATDHINVTCINHDADDLIFNVSNEIGQPVNCNISKNNNSYYIDLQNLAGGFYILSAVSDKGIIYKQKVIKQE